jgi:hypothetical protein
MSMFSLWLLFLDFGLKMELITLYFPWQRCAMLGAVSMKWPRMNLRRYSFFDFFFEALRSSFGTLIPLEIVIFLSLTFLKLIPSMILLSCGNVHRGVLRVAPIIVKEDGHVLGQGRKAAVARWYLSVVTSARGVKT